MIEPMIALTEPTRWYNIVNILYSTMNQSEVLLKVVPILADIFVFTYPVYLLTLYGWWRYKKNSESKVAAIMIGANVAFTVIINIFIQFFVQKERPIVVLWLENKNETVLHQYLPSSSFPSDHAAVSMSIAIASILRGLIHKDKKYIWFGSILASFSVIMCLARITTAVHRPTDILGGMCIGIIVPLMISYKPITNFWRKIATRIANKI